MTDSQKPKNEREKSLEINNEKALQQLAWALENSTGKFKLILARCNYTSLRSRLIGKLQEICQVKISVLQLRESGKTIYAAIREEFGDNLPAALMVSGLESVQELPQILANANQLREEFRKSFPFPLVLWMNDDVYRQLMQFAPDLESWATSKNFMITKDELAIYIKDLANSWFSNDLTLCEYNYLILKSELEAAQKDLLLDEKNYNLELEADLESLSGFVAKIADKKDSAIEHYKNAFKLWRQINLNTKYRLEAQAKILTEIYTCYYLKAIKYTDKNHICWENTKIYLQKYLSFIYKINRPDLIYSHSIQIGEILRDLNKWEALKKLFTRVLEIYLAANKPLDLAKYYGFLAEAALGKKNWQEAYIYSQKALISWSRILDSQCLHDASLYKYLLAKSEYYLGKKSEAIVNLETARKLGDPLEDLKLYVNILKYLQQLYFEEKEYLKAYDIKQQLFSVEQQFGLRAFIGAGILQSFKANFLNKEYKYSETIAPEIAASTRQLDVQRLMENIGRNDCKLIVLYGDSGVGKSSLINAGLEPALKNQAIGIKDNLPVVIRAYTNWQEELAEKISRDMINNVSNSRIFKQLAKNEESNIRTILIFDQFEEFFFVYTEQTQRRKFFEFLAECLHILSVKVILSLRVDYLHYLLDCNKLPIMKIIGNDILSSNVLYELGNFTLNDAKSIILSLTESANFPLQAALVDQLVEDLAGVLTEVRPIELQIVGAQLQSENINTLAKYNLLGSKAKEELVKRYLQEVVENCGVENIQIAEILLYSLTDKKGTRPLKTRFELKRDLEEFFNPPTSVRSHSLPLLARRRFRNDGIQLDLILEILVKSGLVLLLPEQPDDRYQLVHDYIATFIRQQKEPNLKLLMEELYRERKQREVSEEKLNKFLKRALAGSIIAGFGLAGLAFTAGYQAWEANKQKQQADIKALEAQINFTEALFVSGETRNASIITLRVVEKLKQGKGITKNNQIMTVAALRQAVHLNYPITDLTDLSGHSGGVNDVAWNPDGTIIASASRDSTIRLWNAATGKPLQILTGHIDWVNSVAWSSDGKTLVSAGSDNSIKLWNTTTGELIKTLSGHSKVVNGVAWSPDGKTLAFPSLDNRIKLLNATTGKLIKTLSGHSKVVNGVAWSPDGKTLASASLDNHIKLWDPTTGRILKNLSGRSTINFVFWSPDGKTLASAGLDNHIKLWDPITGKQIKTLTGHKNVVNSVTWSLDSKTLVSASKDKSIKLWNVTTGKLIKTLNEHSDAVNSVAWSPDGETLASASSDKSIKLWNASTGKPLKILNGHNSEWIAGVAWSPDGKTLASANYDKTIKIWDASTGILIKSLSGHTNKVNDVAWSPDGKTLASASFDKNIKLWDVTAGSMVRTLSGHTNTVNSIAWSPGGKILASASSDKSIKLWDITTSKPLKIISGHSEWVNSVAWSPNGKTLASASSDKSIKLWDAATGQQIKTLSGHRDTVNYVAWSPDGKTLTSASFDKNIKLWDATAGTIVRTLSGHTNTVNSIAWSPGGKTLASASSDNNIKLWDTTTGKQIKTLSGHHDWVTGIAWSPKSKTLASASADKKIILWNFDFENLVENACNRLENYLAFHTEELAKLETCQTPSLLVRAAEVLVVQGEEEVKNGETKTAVEKFRQALKWNPQLNFDPEKKIQDLKTRLRRLREKCKTEKRKVPESKCFF